MNIRQIGSIMFCMALLMSCAKDADIVSPLSPKSEFIGDHANLNVLIYDDAASNNCENGCSGNQSNIRVGLQSTISLFESVEDYQNAANPLKQINTDQSGSAKFEFLSHDSYYLYVTSALGSHSLKVNTPRGKTSSVSIGL